MTGQDVVDRARYYLGTPYQHQGRTEKGLDCGGLLLVVGRDLGLTNLEHLGYSNSPDGEVFGALLDEECIRLRKNVHPEPGLILAMDYGQGIQHTAFVTAVEPRLTIIHAKRPFGKSKMQKRGVIEQYIHGRDLRAWTRTYAIKGVTYEGDLG